MVLDLIRERKAPHSPENVIEEFSKILKTYGISKAYADKYAGMFPVEQFRNFGITLEPSDRVKSAIYTDFLPLLNSARVELLDNTHCINQLCNLERRTARGGRDIVDHPANSHDDLINAAAGAAVNASLPYGGYDPFMGCGAPVTAESDAEEARAYRVASLMNHIYRSC